MESLAYLELALVCEALPESKFFDRSKRSHLSSQTYVRLLSLALMLSVLSAASSAFAQINPENPNLRSVQDRLRELGYFNRSSTGMLGPVTQQALTNFQRDYQLSLTGRPDRNTVTALNSLGVRNQPFQTTDTKYKELRLGEKGEDVSALQRELQNLGYFTATPTGTFGKITQESVRSFQQVNRLPISGVADSQTLALLFGSRTPVPPAPIPGNISGNGGCKGLRFGDRGATVDLIQRQLKDLGYFKGPVDGKFRERTLYAVTRFQQDNFLVSDGCADTATLRAIDARRAEFEATFAPKAIKPQSFAGGFMGFGDTGSQVKVVQRRLQELRYYAGSINGLFDRSTEAALMRFQTANRLSGTGKVDRSTNAALQQGKRQISQTPPLGAVGLRRDTGPAVVQLQSWLRNVGKNPGPTGGVFGAETELAVVFSAGTEFVAGDGYCDSGDFGCAPQCLSWAGGCSCCAH